MINGWVVELPYPTPESGWTYRFDLGSNSQHRWDYRHSLILIVRHTTCTKGLFTASPCRNCFMKEKWRRECCNPSNIWFIQASHNPTDAIDALKPRISMSTARQADRPTCNNRIIPPYCTKDATEEKDHPAARQSHVPHEARDAIDWR
eukprot:3651883-Prymnesium_polylepis.1